MNSIKTHIDSKQFTDLFNQRYVKSLNEIRKSNPFSKMIINISNIKDLLDNNEDGYVNDCYQIDNNFLNLEPQEAAEQVLEKIEKIYHKSLE